jgi:hypothetical protein
MLISCAKKEDLSSPEKIQKSTLADTQISRNYYQAVESAVWGMPIVAFDAMRQAFLRDAGAKYNDIVYWSKQADCKFQLTTPNASSWYVYIAINTKQGPVVLDIPPALGAGLFGSMNDAWQIPQADVGPTGLDQGKGGKYLLLPPSYKGEIPSGYFPVHFDTYNGYSILRAIPVTTSPENVSKALELVKKTKMYLLSEVSNPPTQRHIDMAGKLFDGVARFDISFYESLSRMVDEEPIMNRDLMAVSMLKAIGIEKGKDFNPSEQTKKMLNKAIEEAHQGFILNNQKFESFFEGKKWSLLSTRFPIETAFKFFTDEKYDLDSRAAFFFLGCAPPKKAFGASFYLMGQKDSNGNALKGSDTYKLHVPANVPVKQFWAATVYDQSESNFFRESPKIEVNSYQKIKKNSDGSVDLYFGPKPPAGKESNWIYTSSEKAWFVVFRFYGPKPEIINKKWELPDIEKIK